jgi:hypothetical protein
VTWVLQATGTYYVGDSPYDARMEVGQVMGHPRCVNETYGCMSAQCVIDCFDHYGLEASSKWVTFEEAYALFGRTTGVMSGSAWNHYVGLRGVLNGDLYVANSAPGWKGIQERLGRIDFQRLGPFRAIWLERV